ncbi:hypothetical protein [Roseobacter sp. HKCCA0434]|uniref:hypothetical protein n=1 Tax=Roseobacter sp. HKCCA0434 TaxID=3079297 RepID=UPI002905A98C|nr:hypothetical protein [Roseobacter sp. HKCCA0434]
MIIRDDDLYTQTVTQPLTIDGRSVGSTTIQYVARRYVDLRNLGAKAGYVLTFTQRFFIPNTAPFDPGTTTSQIFSNYPALVTNTISLDDPDNLIETLILVDYAPQTVNAAVTSNESAGSSSSMSNSIQHSAGSSLAQTNSYTSSVGFTRSMKPSLPSRNINKSQSNSSTRQASASVTNGQQEQSGTQFSDGSSMSIKDWGSYVQLDTATCTMPTWIFSQEYPWNLIDYRTVDGSGELVLPQYVIDRLWDGEVVNPPSELSLFGINFVCKAGWLIELADGVLDTSSLAFNHALKLTVATHKVDNDGTFSASINAYADPASIQIGTLDLPRLALDPLSAADGPSLIGFVPGQFLIAPRSDGTQCAITAEDNTSLATATGFTSVSRSGFMATDFTAGATQLAISFKLDESASDIGLSFKHWVAGNGGVTLSVAVNGSEPIIRYFDAKEAGSGGENVTTIPLRVKDFSSLDYCDLLTYGLNDISVTLMPDATDGPSSYNLMALAIG